MPLMHGKSGKSFEHNVRTEMHEGKPQKQSLAIAYAIKRKAAKQHKAMGGDMCAHGKMMGCPTCHEDGGPVIDPEKAKQFMEGYKKPMAKGGSVHEDEMMTGYEAMPKEHEMMNHEAEMEDNDMIDRIMAQRYSEGGKVANDVEPEADEEPAQYDELAKDDDIEFHYTGANSGDELGDEEEDEDRHDIVSRIMKQRKMKGKMPRPA